MQPFDPYVLGGVVVCLVFAPLHTNSSWFFLFAFSQCPHLLHVLLVSRGSTLHSLKGWASCGTVAKAT